jgi:hypothetical protein
MHPYIGDFAVGATVTLFFNSSDLGGAPIALGGTPALHCYRDDSTTEDNSGLTLTADYDSRTGMHRVAIDMSADATFFATAHDFYVVITTGTVDGVSVVGKMVAHFSVMNRSLASVVASALTTAVADSVAAVGSRPSPAQALLMLTRFMNTRRAASGSTMTAYKEDATTPSMTFDLDSATNPTDVSRLT